MFPRPPSSLGLASRTISLSPPSFFLSLSSLSLSLSSLHPPSYQSIPLSLLLCISGSEEPQLQLICPSSRTSQSQLFQMPSLQSLPNELLLQVIANLDSHRDVAVLSQQCRRFHHLCDMSSRRKYHRVRLRCHSDSDFALKFILSILREPRLGTYVRDLEITEAGGEPWLSTEVSLPPEDWARLERAIRHAGFDRDGEVE